MTTFSNLDYHRGGKNLTVSSANTTVTELISGFSWSRCDDKNATNQEPMKPRDCATSFRPFCRLLFLSLALAIAPTAVFAEEENHEHGHANDPTGVWLTTNPAAPAVLNTFHSDGTFSGDIQGESAFVPGNENPGFQITSPEHGLWQKTGAKTFAATFFAIEYNDDGSFYAIFKVRLAGVLNGPGNEMDLTASGGEFDLSGNMLPGSGFQGRTAHFARQRLEFP
jgi:hypothetical protein